MTFSERLMQDRRRALLQILLEVEGFGLNEDLLVRELQRVRFGVVTRDDMRGYLIWLERQGLLEVERLEGDLWAATATRAGRDVARGAKHPGVAQPL